MLDQRGQHRRHVEERRQEVVREVSVANDAIDLNDLLHHRQSQPLGDSAFDLADDRERVEGSTHVLGGRDLHHLDQAEIWVDINDCPVGNEGERGVGIALTVLINLRGRRMPVLNGLVDVQPGTGPGSVKA